MECEQFQSNLSAFLDGELAPMESGIALAHLRQCVACRQAVERMRQLEHCLGTLECPPPAANLTTRIMVAVRHQEPSNSRPPIARQQLARQPAQSRPNRIPFWLQSAAIVLIGLTVGMWMSLQIWGRATGEPAFALNTPSQSGPPVPGYANSQADAALQSDRDEDSSAYDELASDLLVPDVSLASNYLAWISASDVEPDWDLVD